MASNKESSNFFDDLEVVDREEAERLRNEHKAKAEKLDYLIHKVFAQSEEGKELLSIWRESLFFKPTADSGMDMVTIGINEGYQRFIRNIVLTIKKVEK